MINNPILKGFCPDPSIIRVEDDYYLATSSFEWWPGVKLFHSKDLAHWQQIPSPLNRVSQLNMKGNPHNGGIWAPCLSYHKGLFFLTYTDVKTQKRPYYNTPNYVVWTDDIYGDWSEPVYLNSLGFDPSLFHAPDGKKYLVVMRNGFKGIYLQEFDFEQKMLTGPIKKIFDGTEAGFTEGPHLYYRKGYYYLIVAEGGTSYGHCVTMARSKNLWGPYKVDPNNPMLTSREDDDLALQRAGHADIVDTPFGEWYMVHLASRPIQGRNSVLGRETAIQKVQWNNDGWLELAESRKTPLLQVASPKGIPSHPFAPLSETDNFDSAKLGVQYTTLRVPLGDRLSLTQRPGWLRLFGKEAISSNHEVSLVARRQQDFFCLAETCMDFSPQWQEHAAGLLYLYNNESFYGLIKTLDKDDAPVLKLLRSDKRVITEEISPIPLQKSLLYLRVTVKEITSQFSYSYDGKHWEDIPYQCDGQILTDEHNAGFTGSHFALYAHDMVDGTHFADFDYFTYQTTK